MSGTTLSFKILEREADWRRRGIREAICVKRVVPGLNKSGGLRCALSPLWDRPLGVKAVRASRPEDGLGLVVILSRQYPVQSKIRNFIY